MMVIRPVSSVPGNGGICPPWLGGALVPPKPKEPKR